MNFTREAGLLIFRVVLPVMILTIQYILFRMARRWAAVTFQGSRRARLAVTLPFVIFNLALIGTIIIRPRSTQFPTWFLWTCAYPFFIWHSASIFLGLILGIFSLARLIVRGGAQVVSKIRALGKHVLEAQSPSSSKVFDASRRAFLKGGMIGAVGISFGGSAYGVIVGRHAYEVTSAEFPIHNLPPQLDNFAIALISDIHSSVYMSRQEMEDYAALVNSLHADMVVVPGDFVNSMTAEVYPFAEAFSSLRAPYGVYGVMGNHDYFASEPEKIAQEVNACGIRMLRNESVAVEKGGTRLCVAGIDDVGRPERAMQRISAAMQGATESQVRLLLCHRPYFLEEAAANGIDLMLSGHTHGGQIVLGRIGNTVIAPASLASPYVWGKYNYGRTQMYVSRGIGTVGLPIRINCPPEVTRITLVGAERST